MENRDIAELMTALRAGNNPPWDEFFARFDRLIRSIVSWEKWHLDAHTREDVAQGIRQEIVRSIAQVRDDATIEYFIKKICIHRIIDEIRRQVRTGRVTVPLATTNSDGETVEIPLTADATENPVFHIVLFERAAAVRDMIDQVGDPCRAAIRAFYFEGTHYKDIAAAEGISINTVGTRLSKCLEKLRKLMKNHTYFKEENDPGTDFSK